MTWLPALVAAFLLVAAIGVRAAGTTPTESGPEFVGRAAALTFDEHAAVASALLQPDVPLFTADQLARLHFADEVEAWLRTNTNQES